MQFLAFALAVCAQPAVVGGVTEELPRIESSVRWERNYDLGVARDVVVGEQLIRRKQVEVEIRYDAVYRVQQRFTVQAGIGTATEVRAGSELPVVGIRNIKRKLYQIVDVPGTYALLLDNDGCLFPKLANRWPSSPEWVVMVPKATYREGDPRLERAVRTSRSERPGAENIEIVYNGTDGQALRFQYREYTADDLARPAFAQDLTYPARAKTIRFKGFSIEMLMVTDDGLTYRVTEDGLSLALP